MKKYFVIDFKKIKTENQFNNWIIGHNERKYNLKRDNVDSNRTKDNIILDECKYKSYKDFINSKREEIKKLNEENKIKRAELVEKLVREQNIDKKEAQKIARKKYPKRRAPSNQSIGFSIVIDCTPNKDWTEQDYIRYLKDAESFLKERFKNLEILSSVIHVDEKKPHLHISFSYYDKNEKRFVEKKLMKEKKTDLDTLLSDFERDVAQKYDLHRGDGVTLRKSILRDLNAKKKTIEIITDEKLSGLIKETKKVNVLSTKVVNKIVTKKMKEVQKFNHMQKFKELLVENEKLKKELVRRDEIINELSRENKELKSKNLMLTKLKEKIIEKDKIIDKLIDELSETKSKISKFKEQSKQIIKNKIKKEINKKNFNEINF